MVFYCRPPYCSVPSSREFKNWKIDNFPATLSALLLDEEKEESWRERKVFLKQFTKWKLFLFAFPPTELFLFLSSPSIEFYHSVDGKHDGKKWRKLFPLEIELNFASQTRSNKFHNLGVIISRLLFSVRVDLMDAAGVPGEVDLLLTVLKSNLWFGIHYGSLSFF